MSLILCLWVGCVFGFGFCLPFHCSGLNLKRHSAAMAAKRKYHEEQLEIVPCTVSLGDESRQDNVIGVDCIVNVSCQSANLKQQGRLSLSSYPPMTNRPHRQQEILGLITRLMVTQGAMVPSREKNRKLSQASKEP